MTVTQPDSTLLRFTKHHGAGNDFLVQIDPGGSGPLPADLVRALCDRRFGVGADGVIRILEGDDSADLRMVLQNADGGEAEMSGNGMRCLAQAAVLSALVLPPTFTVATAAGVKTVVYLESDQIYAAEATVGLGRAVLGDDQPQKFIDRKVRTVDMGNPHLVMFGPDLDDVDVDGHRLAAAVGLRGRDQRRVHHLGRRTRQPGPAGVRAGRGRDPGLRHRKRRRRGGRPQLGTGGHRSERAQPGRHPATCRWPTTRSCCAARSTASPPWWWTRPPCWPPPGRR